MSSVLFPKLYRTFDSAHSGGCSSGLLSLFITYRFSDPAVWLSSCAYGVPVCASSSAKPKNKSSLSSVSHTTRHSGTQVVVRLLHRKHAAAHGNWTAILHTDIAEKHTAPIMCGLLRVVRFGMMSAHPFSMGRYTTFCRPISQNGPSSLVERAMHTDATHAPFEALHDAMISNRNHRCIAMDHNTGGDAVFSNALRIIGAARRGGGFADVPHGARRAPTVRTDIAVKRRIQPTFLWVYVKALFIDTRKLRPLLHATRSRWEHNVQPSRCEARLHNQSTLQPLQRSGDEPQIRALLEYRTYAVHQLLLRRTSASSSCYERAPLLYSQRQRPLQLLPRHAACPQAIITYTNNTHATRIYHKALVPVRRPSTRRAALVHKYCKFYSIG
eukprot:IDg174t1